MKKEPVTICKQSKDAHMNTIGEEFILVNLNKNCVIYRRESAEMVTRLNI